MTWYDIASEYMNKLGLWTKQHVYFGYLANDKQDDQILWRLTCPRFAGTYHTVPWLNAQPPTALYVWFYFSNKRQHAFYSLRINRDSCSRTQRMRGGSFLNCAAENMRRNNFWNFFAPRVDTYQSMFSVQNSRVTHSAYFRTTSFSQNTGSGFRQKSWARNTLLLALVYEAL